MNDSFSTRNDLPYSSRVNVSVLGRLFRNTTTSYKFLFFLSLLELLQKYEYKGNLSLAEIQLEMLTRAWFPHNYFRLNFGAADGIANALNELNLNEYNTVKLQGTNGTKRIREAIRSCDFLKYNFLRYVPFYLLNPFFSIQTKGMGDKERIENIVKLSYETRDQNKSFYFFSDDKKTIHFHHDWLLYFYENQIPLKRFVEWHWLEYMQKRNPSVPNIQNKLFPPQQRVPLTSQTSFWKTVLHKESLSCTFTGKPLQDTDFTLDHFLPWTFVAHDQLWNLIPVSQSVNSSKSNNLPSLEKYFDGFARLQYMGLTIFHETGSEQAWNNAIEPYLCDLQLSRASVLDKEKLTRALRTVITPLYGLAENQGFKGNWLYRERL